MDSSADTRLGELLGHYQRLRAEDPEVSIAALRTEAGPLYPELVELVECLDLVLEDGAELSAPPPDPAPAKGRRWLLPVAALAAAGIAAALLWPATAATTLTVRSHPAGDVTIDGDAPTSAVTAGTHVVRVTHEGFRPFERRLVLREGNAHVETVYLEPLDPFDFATMDAVARSCRITIRALTSTLPRPVNAEAEHDAQAVLSARPVDEEALRLERARLPAALRDEAVGRYIVAERLYRSARLRAAYREAAELASAHPGRKGPLALALHALWGLDLVESDLYRELHGRYREAD